MALGRENERYVTNQADILTHERYMLLIGLMTNTRKYRELCCLM